LKYLLKYIKIKSAFTYLAVKIHLDDNIFLLLLFIHYYLLQLINKLIYEHTNSSLNIIDKITIAY
jgi:hypothetical protein